VNLGNKLHNIQMKCSIRPAWRRMKWPCSSHLDHKGNCSWTYTGHISGQTSQWCIVVNDELWSSLISRKWPLLQVMGQIKDQAMTTGHC